MIHFRYVFPDIIWIPFCGARFLPKIYVSHLTHAHKHINNTNKQTKKSLDTRKPFSIVLFPLPNTNQVNLKSTLTLYRGQMKIVPKCFVTNSKRLKVIQLKLLRLCQTRCRLKTKHQSLLLLLLANDQHLLCDRHTYRPRICSPSEWRHCFYCSWLLPA